MTRSIATTYAEAAEVLLDEFHTAPTEVIVEHASADGYDTERYALRWHSPEERQRAAWANKSDAARDGAYGVALSVIEAETGLLALRRAEERTGADYYVAAHSDPDDLEGAFRLEVTGSRSAGRAAVRSTHRRKEQQTRDGESDLPALACAIGFRQRLAVWSQVVDKP